MSECLKFNNFKTEESLLENEPIQYRPIPYIPFCQETFTSKASNKFKILQKFKLILGAIILLPVRIILLIFALTGASISAAIATYKKPITVYGVKADCLESQWSIVFTNRFMRLALFALGLTSIEFKGKVPVDFDQNTPWLKYSVVAAPHSATFDWSMIVARATRLLSPVIKAEAGLIKGVRHVVRVTMPIVVKRESSESRKEAVLDTNRRINEGNDGNWYPVLCFPEGTNCNRKQFCRFKAGPFIAGKPLIPVIMSYPNDEKIDDNDLVTWPHFGRSVGKTILLGMCRLQTTIIYTFLDTYYPTQEEQKNPSLYAENVRQLMSKQSKIPTSDWTFEDTKLMRICQKSKFQPEIGGIQIAKIFNGIKGYDKIGIELLNDYIDVLKNYMPRRSENRIKGLLPVIEKNIIINEIINKNRNENSLLKDFNTPQNKIYFNEKLPNYVSFEQLSIIYAKLISQKIT